jgi:hypothetical protein
MRPGCPESQDSNEAVKLKREGGAQTPEREPNMIQIQNANQFTNAAARCQKERMLVQPTGFRQFRVTNRKNGHVYTVSFSTINKKFFGCCNCAAGYPMRGNQKPLVCKHLFASYLVLRALSGKVQTNH